MTPREQFSMACDTKRKSPFNGLKRVTGPRAGPKPELARDEATLCDDVVA